jgi:L-lysine 2,3-aminomutase
LHSDAVELDPSVKRFSAAVDQTEFRLVVQGQVISPVINRKDMLMEWLVYLKANCKAPYYLHDCNIICTYKEIGNQMQQGKTRLIPRYMY